MKQMKFLALLSTLAVLCSLSAFARDNNQHSVDIADAVQVGGTQLQPGHYKLQWQGTGPAVQVTFLRNGRTVATAQGTLKTNDEQITQDQVITNTTNKELNEIDFRRNKEAIVFQMSGM
jgi:opacity protein-like surface antigen